MKQRVRIALPIMGALVGLALLAGVPSATAAASPDQGAATDAGAYCTDHGGTVQVREAYWNTNADEAQWLDLGRSVELCRFQTLGPDDPSRIYIDLQTLVMPGPTLASLAYLSKVPMGPTIGGANPATLHCADLGGSAQFGDGAAGGGWVARDDPDDVVVGMCVFPDGSMIDEWGIAYYSGDAVRGADLARILVDRPEQLPPIFGSAG